MAIWGIAPPHSTKPKKGSIINLIKNYCIMEKRFNEMLRDLLGCGCIPVLCSEVVAFRDYCLKMGVLVFGGAICPENKSQYVYVER